MSKQEQAMNAYSEVLRSAMGKAPVLLVAVGVALIHKNEILLVQRLSGEWDLPAGHLELGESLEEAAIREVYEETGLRLLSPELLGILSGREIYHPRRNAYYVAAAYLATDFSGDLRRNEENLDLGFFPLQDLPKPLGPATPRVLEALKEQNKL